MLIIFIGTQQGLVDDIVPHHSVPTFWCSICESKVKHYPLGFLL